jgi:hypothetical protein
MATVQRMPNPATRAAGGKARRSATKAQCQCDECLKEPRLLQRAAVHERSRDKVPSIVYDVLESPGQPLNPKTRAFMEERFNYDFSSVRVHSNELATVSARMIRAKAYTVGNDVIFDAKHYDSNSHEGMLLLGHELVHVMQQSNAPRASGLSIANADDFAEAQAESFARLALSGNKLYDLANIRSDNNNRDVLRRASFTVQRSLSTECYTFNSWIGNYLLSSKFGHIAEKYLRFDYEEKLGLKDGTDVYFDDAGISDSEYIIFLVEHNEYATKLIIQNAKGVSRPDILVDKPPVREYEELKPNNATQRAKGEKKLNQISLFMQNCRLRYRPGDTYKPPAKINVISADYAGIPFELSLRITRSKPGLLLYDICITTDWTKGVERALEIILAFIIAILLKGARVPQGPVQIPVPVASADEGVKNSAVSRGEPPPRPALADNYAFARTS